jgi:hypothetical protein
MLKVEEQRPGMRKISNLNFSCGETFFFDVEPPFRRWLGRNKQGIEDTWTLFKIV